MKVKIINKSNNPLPIYATPYSAGMDVYAHLKTPMTLAPFERQLIPTGLHIALPKGYEAQLRMRSGLALRKGLILPNAPATIDADFRGELKLLVANISQEPQVIKPNERVAQMVIAKYQKVEWELVHQLDETERGSGGFGSTGA